jgi:hypothetical protein
MDRGSALAQHDQSEHDPDHDQTSEEESRRRAERAYGAFHRDDFNAGKGKTLTSPHPGPPPRAGEGNLKAPTLTLPRERGREISGREELGEASVDVAGSHDQ